MNIYNSSQNNLIISDAKVADNFFTRTIGLLSKKSISSDEGLVIKPCCSIHTFFMKFSIDVIFVNKKNEIVALHEKVRPFRILPIHHTAYYVIELAEGTIANKGIKKGNFIKITE